MSKTKVHYVCNSCGVISPKWAGQCPDCKEWNTLLEEAIKPKNTSRAHLEKGYTGDSSDKIITLDNVVAKEKISFTTEMQELDRVLGEGVIRGSVILIGGDPGIGKSTLLLQAIANLSKSLKTLYVSGEESAEQVSLRGRRLKKDLSKFSFISETEVEKILSTLSNYRPDILVIDSIQTIYCENLNSVPGSVSQIRESAAALVRYAKQTGCAIFIIGHVTKEGAIAGPRVLEHMVDTVLYFEGEQNSKYRLLRVVKNRFGAVNELGIFAMTETGLKGISNPSAIFLTGHDKPVSGSVVLAVWEGSRAILVELQSLVDDTISNARRVTIGCEQNRLTMLLAVLSRHCDIGLHQQDVYVNVVGGIKISETTSDLAILAAVISAHRNKVFDNKTIVFGEVGLSGEIRPVPNGEDRIITAKKQGFNRAIIPHSNMPRKKIDGIEIIGLKNLQALLEYI